MQEKQIKKIYLGCDLGQANDYTALVLMEHVEYVSLDRTIVRDPSQAPPLDEPAKPASDPPRDEYHVRYIDRFRGISYEDVKIKIRALLDHVLTQTGHPAILILDASGVGRPIVDSLRDLNPVAVTVHGGANTNYEQGSWRVPKRDLVGAAKVLLGKGQLKIAKELQYADVLITELENFRVKVNISSGHDSYEAWRVGDHDDLVFALSLCCWYYQKKSRSGGRVIKALEVGVNEGRWSRLSGFGNRGGY